MKTITFFFFPGLNTELCVLPYPSDFLSQTYLTRLMCLDPTHLMNEDAGGTFACLLTYLFFGRRGSCGLHTSSSPTTNNMLSSPRVYLYPSSPCVFTSVSPLVFTFI